MQRFALSADLFGEKIQTPLLLAFGMLAGTTWYFSIDFEPGGEVVFWGAAMACLGLWWGRLKGISGALMVSLVVLSGIAIGIASGKMATGRSQQNVIVSPIGPVLIEGWVKAAQPARKGVRLVLQVQAIDGLDSARMPQTVRLTHILSLRTEPGRFVRCWAVLRPPPQPVIEGDYDFARQAWFTGLGAVGYVQGRCRGGALGPPRKWLQRTAIRIAKWRRQLAQHVRIAAGDRAGGFAAALASGDRSFMHTDDQDALRASGLAHLLAISGLHMGIVGGLVFLLFWRALALIEPYAIRWSVKKPAALAALFACAAYLTISGASVATQRAFIMSAVIFGAVLIDRTALSIRSLSIAMIAVLLLAPWSALTPGFQMSFAATGALIATYESWQKHQRNRLERRSNRLIFWFKSLLVTSTVSSLATMPFAMFHFQRIAGLGLLANLFAMPIISLLSAPFAAAALLLVPFGGDTLALRAFGGSLEWVLSIAHLFANWGGDRAMAFPAMPSSSLALLAAMIAIYVAVDDLRVKVLSAAALLSASALVWGMTAKDRIHWAPSGELFLELRSGAVHRIELIAGEGLGPLRFADAPVASTCPPDTFCETGVSWARFRYRQDMRGHISLTIALGSGTERVTIDWQSVVRENGVTLERRGDQLIRLQKPKCGGRPWRRCSPP
ncbi:MAG: ComEC/Rec2 family competence protein [Pseudomonadota bacterium]